MHKQLAIVLSISLITLETFAQADFWALSTEGVREKIDSLKKRLPALQDTGRIECLNNLGESYLALDLDTARTFATQALVEAEARHYIRGKAKAYRNLGRIKNISITDLPKAEWYYQQSLQLFESTGDTNQIAWAWGALGLSKWVLCKFPEAMEALEKAEQLFKVQRDTINLAGTYEIMIATEFQWGHYAKALQYVIKRQDLTGEEDYENLSDLYEAIGDTDAADEYRRKIRLDNFGQLKYNLLIAGSFFQKAQYDSAIHYYRLYSDGAKQNGVPLGNFYYSGLGEVHLALKKYDTALVCLRKALELSEAAKDQNSVMRVLATLATGYKDQGNDQRAIGASRKLLQTAIGFGARSFIRDAHFLLYQLFENRHETDSAYAHLQHYTRVRDTIDRDLTAQKLAFYRIKSEREKANAHMKLLNEEKKVQQQELKESAQQKKFLISGIGALLLISFFIFRNILLKRKNEAHHRKLAESELLVQKLEGTKTKVEFQQQRLELEMQALRSQMNPHFIFNSLNSINRFILHNNAAQASGYLVKFSRLVRLILQHSQTALVPLESELEALRLFLELERLRFNNRFSYRISVSEKVDEALVKVPPLILQPYVENAIWHGLMHKAEKGFLEIEVMQQETSLFLRIMDNGIGRKKAAAIKERSGIDHESMGLKITEHRIAMLQQAHDKKASIVIHDLVDANGCGAGTEVVIQIPVLYD